MARLASRARFGARRLVRSPRPRDQRVERRDRRRASSHGAESNIREGRRRARRRRARRRRAVGSGLRGTRIRAIGASPRSESAESAEGSLRCSGAFVIDARAPTIGRKVAHVPRRRADPRRRRSSAWRSDGSMGKHHGALVCRLVSSRTTRSGTRRCLTTLCGGEGGRVVVERGPSHHARRVVFVERLDGRRPLDVRRWPCARWSRLERIQRPNHRRLRTSDRSQLWSLGRRRWGGAGSIGGGQPRGATRALSCWRPLLRRHRGSECRGARPKWRDRTADDLYRRDCSRRIGIDGLCACMCTGCGWIWRGIEGIYATC